MWLLTGVLLGSIIASTHDNEEACRGRQAMLEKVKGVSQLSCRAANNLVYGNGTSNILTVPGRTGAFD